MTDPSTVRVVRRHGLLALIIAGTCVVLMGAFVLLWIKLPVWAPEWVVEHSPFADPIVRAVVEGGSSQRAAERLGGMGAAQVPRLLALIDHPDRDVRALVADSLERILDERVIRPLFDRLLTDAKDGDVWVGPLAKQDPTVVAGLLVPHLVTGRFRNINLLSLAGAVADDRVVAPLQAIMEQPWEKELLDDNHLWVQPTTLAAMGLMDSPCVSAEPALLRSFVNADPVIRRRVVFGIHMSCFQGSSGKRRQWDGRLQDMLLRALADPDALVREQAACLMNIQRIEGAEPILIEMSRSSDFRLRRAAILGLNARWYGPVAHRRIVECLRDPEPKVQLFAVYACGQIDDPPPTTELLAVLSSPDERVREAACSTLWHKSHMGDPRVFPAMLRLMDDPNLRVRQRAAIAAFSAASTPEQKQAASEAYSRLQERVEAGKPPTGSPSAK